MGVSVASPTLAKADESSPAPANTSRQSRRLFGKGNLSRLYQESPEYLRSGLSHRRGGQGLRRETNLDGSSA
eukprot:12398227-Karenia_brevis.AAC.1